MLTSLGFAALIAIVGTIVGVLWAGVIRLVSVPGTAFIHIGTRRGSAAVVSAGTVLTLMIEIYLLLAFAYAASSFVAESLHRRPALPGWPLWAAGWYLAIAPVLFSGWNPPGTQARDERDIALRIAWPVAAVGYWIFVLWPNLPAAGWPWVPTLSL